MPHLDIKMSYNLQLTTEEFKLIGLALAGKLEAEIDKKAAQELNIRLQEMRTTQVSMVLDASKCALQKAKEIYKLQGE